MSEQWVPGSERANTDRPPVRVGWLQKRRLKVIEELDRNRSGEYKVPTWVLVAGLVAVIACWIVIIFFA